MFHKLKIRLTMINLVLISIVLLIIFTGMFLMMRAGMHQQAGVLMRAVARDEGISPSIDFPNAPRVLANCFFVKLDKNGVLLMASENLPLSRGDTQNLTARTFADAAAQGMISHKAYRLRYMKVPKEYGHIVVFLDRSSEYEVLSWLLITSAVIGLVSLGLVFLVSLYLSSRAIIPIRSSWEKQNAFVADASHELRTPLAVMKSNLEIVLENTGQSVESQGKWLGNVNSELERMTRLVDDLLFLARTDMAEEVMPVAPFHLSNSLQQAAEAFEPFASRKGLQLVTDIQPEMIISGNEGRIRQLAAILLDNAVKYTPAGGKVTLRAYTGENHVEIVVSDSGEGIPREHLDKVFERFYRVDKSRSRNHGGTGLGLSIAKCIALEHKGDIQVSSTVGKGTSFRVLLPLASNYLTT